MCEILVMLKTDNTFIQKKELNAFLQRCLIAGESNNDGYGFINEKWFYKNNVQLKRDDINKILKDYNNDSRFFICHVRYATCEKSILFTHPFNYESFIGVHNGVVQTTNKGTGSDSLDLFNALNDSLKRNNNNMYDSIKETIKEFSGSYSILIYAKNENALYYLRNNPSFDFMFVSHNNVVYGATDNDKIKVLDYKLLNFFETAYFSRPVSNMVYKINIENGNFSRLGTVSEKPYIINSFNTDNKNENKNENKKQKSIWWKNKRNGFNDYGIDSDYSGW